MKKMINTIKQKKGFTLIELIVVIAVIGILVLLAAPKFLGYTKDAKLAQVKNDISSVEKTIIAKSLEKELVNEDYFDSLSSISQTEVEEYASKGQLFSKNGEADVVEGGPFYKIPDEDVSSAKSKLKGDFIVNEDGKVYYIDNAAKNDELETPNEPEDSENEHLAKDEDFEWEEDSNGYDVEGKDRKGYYKYVNWSTDTVEIPHEIEGHKMTSYYRMFERAYAEKVISTNENITDMRRMFNISFAYSLDLSSFDTSNVVDMEKMFSSTDFKSLDLSSFDTSNVTNMEEMFYHSSVTSLDLSSFDTSNVTNMRSMFQNSQTVELDVSSWDTRNVTDMEGMFSDSAAISLDLSNFNTSSVTTMSSMFRDSQATSLNLNGWNTSEVEYMNSMFEGSPANILNLSHFDTSSVYSMNSMFQDSLAKELNLSNWKTNKAFDMRNMFSGSQVGELDLSSFDMNHLPSMEEMFKDARATKGYAKSQEDIELFNDPETEKPIGLEFTLKQ